MTMEDSVHGDVQLSHKENNISKKVLSHTTSSLEQFYKEKQQRLREERQAKKSSLDFRHYYIFDYLCLVTGLDVDQVVEFVVDGNQLETINEFLSKDGCATLIFFYQENDSIRDNGLPTKIKKKLFVAHADRDSLTGMCIYFLHQNKSKELNHQSIIKEITFGFINAEKSSLINETNNLVDCVYGQALLSLKEWHSNTSLEKVKFLSSLDTFVDVLKNAQQSIDDTISLQECDTINLSHISTTSNFSTVASDSNLLRAIETHAYLWIKQIEQVLAESEQMRRENDDIGPKAELSHWKQRLAKFNSLLTEIKSQKCKALVGVLVVAKSRVLKSWKELDTKITDFANEAKDNVKFLYTLEKFCEPLYHSDPVEMIDAIPGLINAIRMVHNYSRYYNTSERMTAIFVKITNQMVTACKNHITDQGSRTIWDETFDVLQVRFNNCNKLSSTYQNCFMKTKLKIDESKDEKRFDFSETYIFGKINSLTAHLDKIRTMLKSLKQFECLASSCIEGIDSITSKYLYLHTTMRKKNYDYLDFRKSDFDSDFEDFKSSIADIEMQLVAFMEKRIDQMKTIPLALHLLSRFKGLKIEALQKPIDQLYEDLLLQYGKDLEDIMKIYQKQKDNPPVARNMPPISGKIAWARNLFQRIQKPMEMFQENEKVLSCTFAKKIVRNYNKTGRILLEFEVVYYDSWLKQVDVAKSSFQASVFVRHPKTREIFVNFDPLIFLLMRETECLSKMNLEVPLIAQQFKQSQNMFIENYNKIKHLLTRYKATIAEINPLILPLMGPHLTKLETALQPGFHMITWMSLNIQHYIGVVYEELEDVGLLIQRANTIITVQIEKNLHEISCIKICDTTIEGPCFVDDFLTNTKELCKLACAQIQLKNELIEKNVNELCDLLLDVHEESKVDQYASLQTSRAPSRSKSRLGSAIISPSRAAYKRKLEQKVYLEDKARELTSHFHHVFCEAIVKVIRVTLENLRRRILCKSYDYKEKSDIVNDVTNKSPLLFTYIVLKIPNISLEPTLDEIQKKLNLCAAEIVSISRNIFQWKDDSSIVFEEINLKSQSFLSLHDESVLQKFKEYFKETDRTYFKNVISNKEILKLLASIMTLLNSELNTVSNVFNKFKVYDHVWMLDKEITVTEFLKSNPLLQEFEEKFLFYRGTENVIAEEFDEIDVGFLLLSPEKMLLSIETEVRLWIGLYGRKLYSKYKALMLEILKFIQAYTKRLQKPITDLEDVRFIMQTLQDVRNEEISVDMKITLIEDAFTMLTKFEISVLKDDFEKVDTLRYLWKNLVTLENCVQDNLVSIQSKLKKELVSQVGVLKKDVHTFTVDYSKNGPNVPNLSASEASDRLIVYQHRYDILYRKYITNCGGELLFGIPITEYGDFPQIRKEFNLLQKLYNLYNDVNLRVGSYLEIRWQDVNIETINEQLQEFQIRCRKLPKALQSWQVYSELRLKIDNFKESCPLLELMRDKSMKVRHWKKIEEITCHIFDIESDNITLSNIIESPILDFKEDIEDICVAATKERDIESKLSGVMSEWNHQEFSFSKFKNRGELLLKGEDTMEIISLLEDSLMVLTSLMTNRYNTPFKKKIQLMLNKLSNTSDILENWLFVQNLWIYLEAVFVGGDIARQLPKEAKRFMMIDKSWQKIMQRAHETTNVVSCCTSDDGLKQLLSHLQEQLELCQKSLSGYLEKKRLIFPRFYFVSDPALLEILGQASDSHTIQDHLLSIFDNIKSLKFHPKDYNKIEVIYSKEKESIKLNKYVMALGNVEDWLNKLQQMAQQSLHGVIRQAYHGVNDYAFDLIEFLHHFPSQVGLLGIQFLWTRDSTDALNQAKTNRKALIKTNESFLDLLNVLINETTKELSQVERTKFETLITIHVHQRDVFDSLVKVHVKSPTDFDWLKQIRFYFFEDSDKCVVSITNVDFVYQNEFLGCTERLVITPLTDRCYITLAQALYLSLGGSPTGPAGTGKTETVKDMGKSLGQYVVVFNCSDQLDYRGLGRIFKGLALSGSWGCFDEFNRIDLPVLSVAAQQISVILSCKKEKQTTFIFTDGDTVEMNPEFGLFLTMNPPGYGGRQVLPENLKMQFRTVSMMVPDRQIIIRVKLASCGFLDNIILARKFFTLYKLCEEQLSKQVHYDFGLRNILSVLWRLGEAKRKNTFESESKIMMRVLRDMNLSKLVDEDEPLFLSLINDLFPNISLDSTAHEELENAITTQCKQNGLVDCHTWKVKLIQLYETQLVRHGMMTLGPSGAGKTTCIQTLMNALTSCGMPHKEFRMNPKAITAPQMFGRLDVATNDWTDGIFSTLWKKTLKTKKGERTWIVLDGPVDAVWIENLNSVLDDNKTLTLANGDRIPMSPMCKIIFEPHNIDNASPATVSRNGMIYMSTSGLGWKPLLQAWMINHNKNGKLNVLNILFEETFEKLLVFVYEELKAKMDVLECNYIKQCLDILIGNLCNQMDKSFVENELQRHYVFAIMWSIGALLEIEDRLKLECYLKELLPLQCFPDNKDDKRNDSIFEYFVATKTGEWVHWCDKVDDYIYDKVTSPQYSSILVPNVDNVRTNFLIDVIAKQEKGVLLIGEQGTAKSVMIKKFLEHYNPKEHLQKTLNFSSASTPMRFQRGLEGFIDKRIGSTYGPVAGKKMTLFIDDINMPVVNQWGDQVTNEIVRQVIEMKGCYNLDKPGDFMAITDVQFVAAMIHPGGGRNDIPERLKRHFSIFNCTLPSNQSIDKIFSVIVCGHFNKNKFSHQVIKLAPDLVKTTRRVWQITKVSMLPTPAKFHYVFNLRDLSRIWEGMLKSSSEIIQNYDDLLLLWKHEMNRTIADRFTEQSDKDWFNKILHQTCHEDFGADFDLSCLSETPYFVDFLRDSPELTGDENEDDNIDNPKIYEQIGSFEKFKNRLDMFLSSYNESVRGKGLELVFFNDAMINLIKISRIISFPRGNALLVGFCGSGKRSLTKLASFIAGYKTFQITVTKSYGISNFLDDVKYLYRIAGLQGNPITFIFSDKDIKDESFLEYLNSILSCSELSNFFPKEEMEEITNELIATMKKEHPRRPPTFDNLYKYFVERARNNLHVVLCFSPTGEKLRTKALKFPALVSGCVTSWFEQWPKEALVEVAKFVLEDFQLESNVVGLKEKLVDVMGTVHNKVVEVCLQYFERFRRHTHVSPKSYISFLNAFKSVYKHQKSEIDLLAKRIGVGLTKLLEASRSVTELSKELKQKEKDLKVASEKASTVLKEVTVKAQAAEKVKHQVQIVKDRAQVIVDSIAADRDVAESKLALARPALEEAEAALQTIKASDIATVRRLGKPPHLIMRIMDCVLILCQKKVDPVVVDFERKCVKPSWNESLRFMAQGSFLQSLEQFQKDLITEEMLELMQPYFDASDYHLDNAKRVCGNVAGLCSWTKAMCKFFIVNKEVIPLKDNLSMQEKKLQKALADLADAQNQLDEKQFELDSAQHEYEAAIKEKQRLVDDAAKCRMKMHVASTLINGLSGERERWTEQSKHFVEQTHRLVGDILLGTAFLSYFGPFNQQFRKILIGEVEKSITLRSIPFNDKLDIITLLSKASTLGEWKSQGLPNDELSIQNAIIVCKFSRYPLLIDPQCQGKNWIKKKDAEKSLQVTTFKNKHFRSHLEDALSLGRSLLIEDVDEDVDPILDDILDNNIIKIGSTYKVKVGDKEVDISPNFTMYLTTKLANPTFSPEVSAKTSIIDFTVTVKGLEEQLLGRVTMTEKKELEDERLRLVDGVMSNKAKMKELEDNLLARLSSVKGSLVDDDMLVNVLETTKSTADELTQKLAVANETKLEIDKSREEYRTVATRGSILYFLIVEMSNLNCMYQISLDEFLGLFDQSMKRSKLSPIPSKRVINIIEYLTYRVYKYVCRALYDTDRFLFVLLLALKIDMERKTLSYTEFMTFIKGGASLDVKQVTAKPCKWISDITWLNLIELSKLKSFSGIVTQVTNNEKRWKKWFDEDQPEECPIPDGYDVSLDTFRKLLLIRAWCPDRTISQSRTYIKESLGLKYTQSVILDLEETWEESCPQTPLICFLSVGSDPTNSIEGFAKKKEILFNTVSMGQGQEVHARKLINQAMHVGGWVLLQNCHLCLPFMEELVEIIHCETPHESFRVWLTTKLHESFPITLLQMSIKFTNESPQGLKAGLKRTYTGVSQEQLDFIDIPQWQPLLYTIAFLHTTLQERKKFGSLGWNIPYEFNQSDYECSVQFLQNHLDDLEVRKGVSWNAIRYMIGEVHYGGRVTDDFDKRLLETFTKVWFNESIFQVSFDYHHGYSIPRCSTVQQYLDFINDIPETDRPEVFGLHRNADITYQTGIIKSGLDTILNIQPKDGSIGQEETRETYVQRLVNEMLEKLPANFIKHEVRSRLQKMGAYQPMNIFLKQEVDRMQCVIDGVHMTLVDLRLAIDGSIIMNEKLRDTLDSIYDARVPTSWRIMSWDCSTLGFWMSELVERHEQFVTWLNNGAPPNVFWMTGFFNPQGFITAMTQEVTRKHKGWSLDNVTLQNDVMNIYKNDVIIPPSEGVYIYGLYLEGASWDKRGNKLIESSSKVLFSPLPVVHLYASNTVTSKDRQQKIYKCPIYKKMNRSNETFVTTLDLNTDHLPEHWVLRGVALLCDIK